MLVLGFLIGVYTVGGAALVATLATGRDVTMRDYRRASAKLGWPLPAFFAGLFLASPFLLVRSVMR